jgi:hypothetical protein
MASAPARNVRPSASSTLMMAAPARPPMLKRPWKPDINARPSRRSTSTAWAFIATSTAPSIAPKYSNTAASAGAFGTIASSGIATHNISPATQITLRLP